MCEVKVASTGSMNGFTQYDIVLNEAIKKTARYSELREIGEKLKLESSAKLPIFPPKGGLFADNRQHIFIEERRKQLEIFFAAAAESDISKLEAVLQTVSTKKNSQDTPRDDDQKVIKSMDRHCTQEAGEIGNCQREVAALRRELQDLEADRRRAETDWVAKQTSYEHREFALRDHGAALKDLKAQFAQEDIDAEEKEAQRAATIQRVQDEAENALEKKRKAELKIQEIQAKLSHHQSAAQEKLLEIKQTKKNAVSTAAAVKARCDIASRLLVEHQAKLKEARQTADLKKALQKEKEVATARLQDGLVDDALKKRDEAQDSVDQHTLDLKQHTESLDCDLKQLEAKLDIVRRRATRIRALAGLQASRQSAADALPDQEAHDTTEQFDLIREQKLLDQAHNALNTAQSAGRDTTKRLEQQLDNAFRVLDSRKLVLDQASSRLADRQQLTDTADEEAAAAEAAVEALEHELAQTKAAATKLDIELENATQAKAQADHAITDALEQAKADERPILRELQAESVVVERLAAAATSLLITLYTLKLQANDNQARLHPTESKEESSESPYIHQEDSVPPVPPSQLLDDELIRIDCALAALLDEIQVATKTVNETQAQQQQQQLELESKLQVAQTALSLQEEDHLATNQLRLALQAPTPAQ